MRNFSLEAGEALYIWKGTSYHCMRVGRTGHRDQRKSMCLSDFEKRSEEAKHSGIHRTDVLYYPKEFISKFSWQVSQ